MKKEYLYHGLGILAVWLIAGLLVVYGLKWYSQPEAIREVPNVIGMLKQEAEAEIRALGLEVVWLDSVYNPKERPGEVFEQFPSPESSVKVGRKIKLTTYSQTPPGIIIQVQEGDNAKVAEQELSKDFVVSIVEIPSVDLAGKVVRVKHRGSPVAPGTCMPRDEEIEIVVGYRSNTMVRVPDFMGLTMDEATQVLSDAKLERGDWEFSNAELTEEEKAMAVVVWQNPSRNNMSTVNEGSSVDLRFDIEENWVEW